MSSDNNLRLKKNLIYKNVSYIFATFTILSLILILGSITLEALPSLNFNFIFLSEAEFEGFGGATKNAIVGTLLLATLSPLLATPFAVGTAIYIKKYAKPGKFLDFFGFIMDVFSGTPSIVIGVFGLMIMVYTLQPITGGFSLISGVLALSILILPVLERASEAALDTVPKEIEDASYALGANKWETVSRVSVPYALNGILTGLVLSIGRAAEESAVVILTAGYTQFIPEFKVLPNEKFIFGVKIYPFQDLVASLPVAVYHGYEFPTLVDESEGFAAAFVLIAIVMIINAVARLIVWRRRIG